MTTVSRPLQPLHCEPGLAAPMGASCQTWQGQHGVNFAVYSEHAERVELCLYDAQGAHETARCSLPSRSGAIWHGFVAGLRAGQLYGFRAHGPYQPERGQRFNPHKLLIDPFARALLGSTAQASLAYDYQGSAMDRTDNSARVPKSQVLDWAGELEAGARLTPGPNVAAARRVLYEAHVKGLTQRHPSVPDGRRGRYAGLCSEPMLRHYRHLGITTLCLLPVQQHITEAHLLHKGLSNYWGYNTLAYFIPEPGYASAPGAQARVEFRDMVDQLHRHGFEVVLDVVFNHTAESDALGPTLSWRGLDNASWYVLDERGQPVNFSGCGNTLNLAHPAVTQWLLDCLRWWVQAFGVDGFRFDLASTLGRSRNAPHGYSASAALFKAIAQDPVLAHTQRIAEPWDLGPGGYQLGQFPKGWQEWNDRYRDTSRAYWLGFPCTRGQMAQRLTGSSDHFAHGARSPQDSINLLTAHDGMTLADLTAYRHKHNLANGEHNSDGQFHNLSANAGVEGPTQDAALLAIRGQWRRALLSTLFCSQGVPQLLAGDELGHSQQGNNNAYCQDNEMTWLDWLNADTALTDFVASLIHLRQAHEALRHASWLTAADIAWFNPDGSAMTTADWDDTQARGFACCISLPAAAPAPQERWLLMLNAGAEALPFTLSAGRWRQVLNSTTAQVLQQDQWPEAAVFEGELVCTARTWLALIQGHIE